VYLEKKSVAVEVQYLDNITKKNYLCSRRRLRRLGGLGGLGVVRQVRRVGVRAAPAEMWDR
jgi:hypothetical protein